MRMFFNYFILAVYITIIALVINFKALRHDRAEGRADQTVALRPRSGKFWVSAHLRFCKGYEQRNVLSQQTVLMGNI